MMKLELKNHQVWQDLTEILENLDANVLVREHLELCKYKVCGYWDEQDEFYEEICMPRSMKAELVSSSIGVTHTQRFLSLKFVLKADSIATENQPSDDNALHFGELVLVYDENLEFVDENWLIDIGSPLMIAKRAQQQ